MYDAGVMLSFGIEMDETKVQKALAFIQRTIEDMGIHVSTPILFCLSIDKVSFKLHLLIRLQSIKAKGCLFMAMPYLPNRCLP